MRSTYALSTVITTVCITILTFGLITSMDHSPKDLFIGVLLVACLFTFAIVLSVRGTANSHKHSVTK
jgi:hypothetical protein